VLLQGETLAEYVEREFATADLEITKRRLAEGVEEEARVVEQQGDAADPEKRVELLKNQSYQQLRLSDASQKRLVHERCKPTSSWLPRDQFNTSPPFSAVLIVAPAQERLHGHQEMIVGSCRRADDHGNPQEIASPGAQARLPR